MIKTTRKSFNAIILALAMTLGYMPVCHRGRNGG
jgi:hypothetical protein